MTSFPYTYISPSCLARQGAPGGGKLVSQEIGDCMACQLVEVASIYPFYRPYHQPGTLH